MVWNTPLASLGQLSWVCPLPAPAAPLACSLAGQSEKLKSPWLGVSTALQQLKHQHVINILLILNPKHSTTPPTRRKINSILAETRTTDKWFSVINSFTAKSSWEYVKYLPQITLAFTMICFM